MVRPTVRTRNATNVWKSASGGVGAPTTSDSKHDCNVSTAAVTSSFPAPATDSDVIDFSFVDRASGVSDLPFVKRALQWGSCLLSGKH